jgi:hypothetical protein
MQKYSEQTDFEEILGEQNKATPLTIFGQNCGRPQAWLGEQASSAK